LEGFSLTLAHNFHTDDGRKSNVAARMAESAHEDIGSLLGIADHQHLLRGMESYLRNPSVAQISAL
jgi:hypothetical protein